MPSQFRKNLTNTVLVQGPNMLLGFLIAIILNRLLGPEAKGVYTIFDATARFLLTLLGFSLGPALIFFGSSGKIAIRALSRFAAKYLLLSLLILVLIALALFWFNPGYLFYPQGFDQPEYLLYYIFWVAFSIGEMLFRGLLHALKRLDHANNIRLFIKTLRFVSLGLAFWFFTYLSSSQLVVFVLVVNTVLVGLTYWLYYLKVKAQAPPEEEQTTASSAIKELLRYAGFLQLGALVQFLNYKLDHWIILYFHGNVDLGYYSAASDLAQMVWLPANVALLLLFPYLSDPKVDGAKKELLFLLIARAVTAISLLAVLVVILWGDGLVILLYGNAFAEAGSSFKILMVGSAIMNLGFIHSVWLTSGNKPRYILYASLVAFVCTILFDFLLIPQYGIEGAAWATTIAFTTMTMYHLWLSHSKFGVPLRKSVFMTRNDWKHFRELLDTVD